MAVVLALLTGFVVINLVSRADEARRKWGETRSVTVVLTELAPGDVVGPDDVTRRRFPSHLVPEGALDDLGIGRIVRVPVGRGEPLIERRLAGGALTGPAAMLEPGTRGVAIPHSGIDVPVEVGDRVDLVATFDGAGPTDPTSIVAEAVVVVAVGDDGVTVAVDVERVEPVTYAVIHGTVTLALTP